MDTIKLSCDYKNTLNVINYNLKKSLNSANKFHFLTVILIIWIYLLSTKMLILSSFKQNVFRFITLPFVFISKSQRII